MQICKKNPIDSYPSPKSDVQHQRNGDRPVLLRHFFEKADGGYQCLLATEDDDSVLDAVVHSDIPSNTLDVLRLAVKAHNSRQQKHVLRSTCTLSMPSHIQQEAGEASISSKHIFNLCVRILAPDARDLSDSLGIARGDIFTTCAPDLTAETAESWSPRDFYDSVHVPQADNPDEDFPQTDQLQCVLYPFQRRALRWLLYREGVGRHHESEHDTKELPHGFIRTTDADGRKCLVSLFFGIVTSDEDLPFRLGAEPKGGILAEEMGLGKTVEMIALMCLHKREPTQKDTAQSQIPSSSATLIITPPSILHQWRNELSRVSPNLNVLVYEGLKMEAGKSNHAALLAKCMTHDVIITTYNVLAKEIHYAETPNRNLRHEKRYEKRLSPLTQILWWRVVLDEAQMVESGVSNAARVAKLIPRQLAWCVSGTPVKRDSKDLYGLIDFLHYEPYCNLKTKFWDHLITQHKNVFRGIFRTLALRHTKDQVKHEIKLPPQKRVVITIPVSTFPSISFLSRETPSCL